MSTSVAGVQVRRYVEAVRGHLSDLAPDDREELLQDLEEHLLEVAAEDDGTLEQRLGPPDAYAEELRVSAGLATRGPRTHRGLAQRAQHSTVVRRGTQLAHWARGSRRFRIAIVLGAVLAGGIIIGRSSVSPYLYSDESVGFQGEPFLHHADGSTIANICPYSADGSLLTGVLLFDQFGRPITNSADNVDGRTTEQAKPAILNVYPKSISFIDFQDGIIDPQTGAVEGQKVLTPLPCPAAVTAVPSAPAAPAPGIPTPIP